MIGTPENFVSVARSLIGTPFHHNQCVPGLGMDCIQVAKYSAQKCGLNIGNPPAAYSVRPNGELLKHLAEICVLVRGKPSVGDVLAMIFEGDSNNMDPHHVAVFSGDSIIHAYSKVKKVIEEPYTKKWESMVHSIWRFKEFS